MEAPTSRRAFVKAASAICVGALGSVPQACVRAGRRALVPSKLPQFDGKFLADQASRRAMADDWGHRVHRMPIGVLKPATVRDVIRLIAYANDYGTKVAMRGRGHSVYGQAQVEHGIVMDSSPLNVLRWHGHDEFDAEPGAQWDTVAMTTFSSGLIPPVMLDALTLTVGGTLSVGGVGEMSYRLGAQVDHVAELDVVTGTGDLVTCSTTRDPELFHMMLAGLGQCGMIIAAGTASGKPNPSLALVVSASAVLPFLREVMATDDAAMGVWRIEVLPMISERFGEPLHKRPVGALVFTVRLQRRASAEGAPDHEAMLAANHFLVERYHAAGAKIYPPHAPPLSKLEWQEHYGVQTWKRFASAKNRFDPNSVLAPGPGIFTA